MSAFGSGSLGNYSAAELMEGYAKKVISYQGGNGNLVISSRDRFSGTVSNPVKQPYNNFVIQKGFPIQQGQIMNVKLTEIRFPYAIPNVNQYTNSCYIGLDGVISPFTIANGFYTGDALEAAVQTELNATFGAGAITCGYGSDGRFTFDAGVGHTVELIPSFTNPPAGNPVIAEFGQSLLQIMGFNFFQVDYTVPRQVQVSSVAPLTYTEYIDICSDVLTQYQNLPDSSTNNINRQHIICRLYIANETSTTVQEQSGNPVFPGCVPFVIHRQFKNPKVMKWNSQNSVDRIDIQLFDDAGNPLALPVDGTTYDDFQITFQSSE